MIESETLQAISDHIQSKESGTATVVFENNSIGRVYFDSGNPILAKFRGLEGIEAVEAFEGLSIKTAKFHAGVNIVGSKLSLDPESQPEPQPSPSQPAPKPPPSEPPLGPDQRHIIEQILAEHIGPVSALVVSELPEKIGLESALILLSGEIGDAQHSREFVIRVRRSLQ